MTCKICGSPIDADDLFCSQCGGKTNNQTGNDNPDLKQFRSAEQEPDYSDDGDIQPKSNLHLVGFIFLILVIVVSTVLRVATSYRIKSMKDPSPLFIVGIIFFILAVVIAIFLGVAMSRREKSASSKLVHDIIEMSKKRLNGDGAQTEELVKELQRTSTLDEFEDMKRYRKAAEQERKDPTQITRVGS